MAARRSRRRLRSSGSHRLPWANLETKIGALCRELGVTRQTLYRYLAPDGSLWKHGAKLLGRLK